MGERSGGGERRCSVFNFNHQVDTCTYAQCRFSISVLNACAAKSPHNACAAKFSSDIFKNSTCAFSGPRWRPIARSMAIRAPHRHASCAFQIQFNIAMRVLLRERHSKAHAFTALPREPRFFAQCCRGEWAAGEPDGGRCRLAGSMCHAAQVCEGHPAATLASGLPSS